MGKYNISRVSPETYEKKRLSLIDQIRQRALDESGISDDELAGFREKQAALKNSEELARAADANVVADPQAAEQAGVTPELVAKLQAIAAGKVAPQASQSGDRSWLPTRENAAARGFEPPTPQQQEQAQAREWQNVSPEMMRALRNTMSRPSPGMTVPSQESYGAGPQSVAAAVGRGLDPRVEAAKLAKLSALPADLVQKLAGDESTPVSSRFGNTVGKALGVDLPYSQAPSDKDKYENAAALFNPLYGIPARAGSFGTSLAERMRAPQGAELRMFSGPPALPPPGNAAALPSSGAPAGLAAPTPLGGLPNPAIGPERQLARPAQPPVSVANAMQMQLQRGRPEDAGALNALATRANQYTDPGLTLSPNTLKHIDARDRAENAVRLGEGKQADMFGEGFPNYMGAERTKQMELPTLMPEPYPASISRDQLMADVASELGRPGSIQHTGRMRRLQNDLAGLDETAGMSPDILRDFVARLYKRPFAKKGVKPSPLAQMQQLEIPLQIVERGRKISPQYTNLSPYGKFGDVDQFPFAKGGRV